MLAVRRLNRQRQMAYVLRTELGLPFVGRLTLPDRCGFTARRPTGPACGARRCAWICLLGIWGEAYASGTSVNGIRHEDLEALSFDDNSIDVVLTSDVLEHVADAYRAHGEIFRDFARAVGTSSRCRSLALLKTMCVRCE